MLPGATVATILMFGALHARRLYDDRKVYFHSILLSIFFDNYHTCFLILVPCVIACSLGTLFINACSSRFLIMTGIFADAQL